MGEKTEIAWADSTFNPWLGCSKRSAGCLHCYAESQAKRVGWDVWGSDAPRRVTSDAYWKEPPRWNRKAAAGGRRWRVFCGSMCDWAEDHPVPAATHPRLWEIIRFTPFLDWLLLTKRAERIEECLPADWGAGWPNVWLGVTCENQDNGYRADLLRAIPAVIRFVSYEPALGPLEIDLTGINWLIYGGESGPEHRPDNVDWVRSIRAQCKAAGTAFFFKQRSGKRPGSGFVLDGEIVRNLPNVGAGGGPINWDLELGRI